MGVCDFSTQRACPDRGQEGKGWAEPSGEGMVCSGGEGWGGVGAGLVDPPPGGRGSPGPRSLCHCYHGNEHLTTGNLKKGGGRCSQVPGSGDRERNRDRKKHRERKKVIYLCEDLPISKFSEPGTLWVLNKCPSETKMEPKRLKSPEMPEE